MTLIQNFQWSPNTQVKVFPELEAITFLPLLSFKFEELITQSLIPGISGLQFTGFASTSSLKSNNPHMSIFNKNSNMRESFKCIFKKLNGQVCILKYSIEQYLKII